MHIFETLKHFIITKPYYNFIDCIAKMARKESLNNLSVDDVAMTLYEHLCNQRVDIFKMLRFLWELTVTLSTANQSDT